MKQFSIVHIPVWSFFSKALYRDIGLRWKGTCLGYLILLELIVWIPIAIQIHKNLSAFVDNEVPKLTAQLPTLTISDGEASIDKPEPYIVKDPNTGADFIIVDTTGGITSLDDTSAKVLVMRTKAIFEKNEYQTQVFEFNGIQDFQIGPGQIDGWMKTIQSYAAPVIYPVAVVGAFVYRALQALLYALVGLLFASMYQTRLGYGALYRLAIAAVTPVIIINTILSLAGVNIPFVGLLYLVVTLCYLFFAVQATTPPEEESTAEAEIVEDIQ